MVISARIVILSLLFGGVAGCAQVGTQPVEPVTPTQTVPSIPSPTVPVEATLPSGWETYASQGQCGYAISHPADMDGSSQGTYSWILNYSGTDPSGVVPNFVYVSVIPDDFQSGESGVIYNYDPAEAETLLNMQAGESRSLRDDPNIAPSFTYTRLPDTTLGNQTAQMYENTQPWEFPAGTKEIRYYLKANGCTYLIGGYVDATGSNQPGAINEELFNQVIATFRLTS
jgi:hypothetical protein